MTDYFNFLGLPSVVQELITNEIVHNSIPEDRIQLALTSKYCNELVQRARPKKIIDLFWIGSCFSFIFVANSRDYYKTKEQLMEILPRCQIKKLVLADVSPLSPENYLGISNMLFEAARFATKFDINFHTDLDVEGDIVGFYVKLKHLKSVTIGEAAWILPHYPSKVKLKFGPSKYFLEDLAKKSQNCPLLFFELQYEIPFVNALDECQQFLQTANFSIGAEIRIQNDFLYFLFHFIYLGQNTFMSEMFSTNVALVLINQKFEGRNRRILKLRKPYWFASEIAFNIVSASNPDKNYFSGVFKEDQQRMLINLENVDRDEILLVKFVDHVTKNFVQSRYSASMLESAFPSANFTTPEERIEKINNVLGTNIQLIQAENFAQTVQSFINIQNFAFRD